MSANTFSYLILLLITMVLTLNGFNVVYTCVSLNVYLPFLAQVIFNCFGRLDKVNNQV